MDYLDNGHKVVRIVITGGPCSGKTTAMDRAFEELQDLGYQILMPSSVRLNHKAAVLEKVHVCLF